jgi:hypothetical protein
MGTSSGYSLASGPKWREAKTKATKAASSGTKSNISSALRAHVQAYSGGSRAGARSGGGGGGFRTARQAAGGLVGFIRDVKDVGLDRALEKRGLGHLKGRPVREVIDGLVASLTDGADYIEDVDARTAAAMLLDEILANAATPEELEKKLQEFSDDKSLCDLISRFFRHFLLEHFIRNYWKHLQGKYSNGEIKKFRDELREHLFLGLKFEIDDGGIGNIDWSSEEGRNIIARVEQRTYEVYA